MLCDPSTSVTMLFDFFDEILDLLGIVDFKIAILHAAEPLRHSLGKLGIQILDLLLYVETIGDSQHNAFQQEP